MATQLDTLTVGLRGLARGFKADMDRSIGHLRNFTRRAQGILAKGLKFTGIGAGLTAAVGALTAVGRGFSIAGQLEQDQVAFAQLIGSADAAATHIADLKAFAASTPFQLPGLVSTSRQLLAFGFSQEEQIPLLKQLGDVAAGTGSDLGELGTIFGQVAAAGKLTGERLLQFQERGVPIGPALAKSLGVAESALPGLVSQGKVSAEQFQAAFRQMAETDFAGLMEKQSRTLFGRLSTLSDNLGLALADATGAALEAIRFGDLVDMTTRAVQAAGAAVTAGVQRITPVVQAVIARLAAAGRWIAEGWAVVGPILGRVASGLAGVLAAVGGVAALGVAVAGVAAALTVAAGIAAAVGSAVLSLAATAAPVLAVLAAVGAGVYAAVRSLGGFGPAIEQLKGWWASLRAFVGGILASIATVFRERWQGMLETAVSLGMAVYETVAAVFGAVWGVVQAVGAGIGSAWRWAMRLVGVESTSAAETTGSAFAWIVDAATSLSEKVTLAARVFSFGLNHIGTVADYVGAKVAHFFVRLGNLAAHWLGVGIEHVKWFARNFTSLLRDQFLANVTIAKNGIRNIAAVIANLPSLIAGRVTLDDVTVPLLEGFEATAEALPEIAERVPGALEQALADDADRIGEKLGTGLAGHLAEREAEAGRVADGIADALGGAFAGAEDVPAPELEEAAAADPPELGVAPVAVDPIDQAVAVEEPEAPELPDMSTTIETDVEPPPLNAFDSAEEQLMRLQAMAKARLAPDAIAPDEATPDDQGPFRTMLDGAARAGREAMERVRAGVGRLELRDAAAGLSRVLGGGGIAAGLGSLVAAGLPGSSGPTSPGGGVAIAVPAGPDAPEFQAPRQPRGVQDVLESIAREQLVEQRRSAQSLERIERRGRDDVVVDL